MPKSNYKVDMHSSQLKYWSLQSNPDNPRYNTTTYNFIFTNLNTVTLQNKQTNKQTHIYK